MTPKRFGHGLPLLLAGLLLASAAFAETGRIGPGGAVTALEQLREARGEEFRPRYLLVGPGGQAVSHEDFRGRWQLIAFGYTFCPDICPTTLVEMAAIMKALGEQAGKLQPLFISVDPERDKPEALKAYTEFFDPRIIGLSGSPALIARAARNIAGVGVTTAAALHAYEVLAAPMLVVSRAALEQIEQRLQKRLGDAS